MKTAVIGLGYVGVTGLACLAEQGRRVLGIDIDPERTGMIAAGRSPIVEPGLPEMLARARDAGRIETALSPEGRLHDVDVAMICVGTPSRPDGAHDLRAIVEASRAVAAAISAGRNAPLAVAYRSTLRPGVVADVVAPIFAETLGAEAPSRVEIAVNPEFLREGSAVADYFAPPKIVVGTRDGAPCAPLEALYAGIEAPLFRLRWGEAEMVKLQDNTWHALKVAFGNEIGRICEELGLSAQALHEVFAADRKLNISAAYLRPGGPFGGSCLPKDVRALQALAAERGVSAPVIATLIASNEDHKRSRLERAVRGLAPGARVLLAGLAFKADTDDLRESPAVDLARGLLRAGFDVDIHDPAVSAESLARLDRTIDEADRLAPRLRGRDEAVERDYDRVLVANPAGRRMLDARDGDGLDLCVIP